MRSLSHLLFVRAGSVSKGGIRFFASTAPHAQTRGGRERAFRGRTNLSTSSHTPRGGGGGNGRGDRAREGGGGGGGHRPEAESIYPVRWNLTHDGVLSSGTRDAMRDDEVILAQLFRFLPSNGAISVKSLNAQLEEEVREALTEKHGGLGAFLRARRHLFVVKPRPTDGVLFVAASPLAAQRYAVRNLQRATMREMLGLDRVSGGSRRGPPAGRGGANERGRGRGRGGGRGFGRGRGREGGGREAREGVSEQRGEDRPMSGFGRRGGEGGRGGMMGARDRNFGSGNR
ncbi:unnamed protein product [Phytomonas sp. EM1]|nr:unnamed protein product [Phytomonas sp. EM1]|eukprot:CCW64353.1 unnamed protein product [Phytomonas sp. isolate EM1]